MLAELDDYDWREAFKYAGKPDECPPDAKVSPAPFDREDVVFIVAMENGENEGDNWIGVFKLADGRFAFLSAGCDYTGWG